MCHAAAHPSKQSNYIYIYTSGCIYYILYIYLCILPFLAPASAPTCVLSRNQGHDACASVYGCARANIVLCSGITYTVIIHPGASKDAAAPAVGVNPALLRKQGSLANQSVAGLR